MKRGKINEKEAVSVSLILILAGSIQLSIHLSDNIVHTIIGPVYNKKIKTCSGRQCDRE